MIKKYVKQARCILAIVLSAAMLTACTAPKAPLTETESVADSSQQKENILADQQNFDRLTQDLFLKKISDSGIDFHYTLADPASRGVAEVPLTLGDYSLSAMKEDLDDLKELKENLKTIPIRSLTPEQKLTYRILSQSVEVELVGEELLLYAQPLSDTIGIQAQLPILLAEYTFRTKEDVDRYLGLITDMDRYFGQIIEFEKEKSQAGLFMSDTAADHVLESCEAYLIQADHSFMAETFNTRIDEMSGLSEEEKTAYKEKNLAALEEHFIPAYKLLIDGVTALMGTGTNELGLCYYPQGKEYYEYMVEAGVCSSYDTVEDLQKAIEKQMNSDISALAQIVEEYPKVYEELENYAFTPTEPTEILATLKDQVSTDFPALPESNYTVKYVPTALESSLSPAFYLTPPLDEYEDNVIYINGGEQFKNEDLFPTLAHEGYPGHLYQNVYFNSHNSCDLRRTLSFTSYSEGWATYVEYNSYMMDNGLSDHLGSLLAYNAAISLGVYAQLDISINYDGWNKEQVSEYLNQYYSIEDSEIVDSIYNSLIENPTNYMMYYVGCLEMTQMRRTAENVLKDQFDAKEFNTFLLDMGPAQFSIIQPYFRLWLAEKSK